MLNFSLGLPKFAQAKVHSAASCSRIFKIPVSRLEAYLEDLPHDAYQVLRYKYQNTDVIQKGIVSRVKWRDSGTKKVYIQIPGKFKISFEKSG